MTKYQAISCTTGISRNNDCVTDLTGLVDENINVFMNFNPEMIVGKARTWLEDDVLMVEVESNLELDDIYAVPEIGILGSHFEQNIFTVTSGKIFSIGLINNPSELDVTKLRKVE